MIFLYNLGVQQITQLVDFRLFAELVPSPVIGKSEVVSGLLVESGVPDPDIIVKSSEVISGVINA